MRFLLRFILLVTGFYFTNVLSAPYNYTHFVTVWQTTTANESITIPTTGSGYNYLVDCDYKNNDLTYDNDVSDQNTGNYTCTYPQAGNHIIVISSIFFPFPRIFINNSGDKDKILEIRQWGTTNWTSMQGAFAGATNLVNKATDTPNLSGVSSFLGMFQDAPKIGDDPAANWNWNTSNVTNMQAMFRNATKFNRPIGSWNTSNVTTMRDMFEGTNFSPQNNNNTINWNTANVTDMSGMFRNAVHFNTDLNWDTSNVTDMSGMFAGAISFHRDISSWNTAKVTNMNRMFADATNFNQNLGLWDMQKVGNVEHMLDNSGLNSNNYNTTLQGWATQDLKDNLTLGAAGLTYTIPGANARQTIKNTDNWTFSGDSGPLPAAGSADFISTWQTTSANESITIPTTGSGYSYSVDCNYNGTNLNYDLTAQTSNATCTYANAGDYIVVISGYFPRIYFANSSDSDKDKIISIDQWGSGWDTMVSAFYGASNLVNKAADIPVFTDSATPSFRNMFRRAEKIGSSEDDGNWDWNTAAVINMQSAFDSALNFNKNINSWDTSNVTDMSSLFYYTDFNYALDNWDTSNVTDMSYLFAFVSEFNQDISGWNTDSVTDMSYMFYNTTNFNQNISGWNTDSVTDMNQMFKNANAFNQNIGNWNMTQVSNVEGMLSNSGLSINNYDAVLQGWAGQNLVNNLTLGADGLIYSQNANSAKIKITNSVANGGDNWTINGDAKSNTAPSANAGYDQNVIVNSQVTLNGSNSSDIDNDVLTYTWSQISGASVILNNANTVTTTFTPTEVGILIFSLSVSDGVYSATNGVTITVAKAEQTSFSAGNNKIAIYGDADFSQEATGGQGDGTITYTSSIANVATVDNNGIVTIVGVGTATITASKAESDNYLAATATYTLIVDKTEQAGFSAGNNKTAIYGDADFSQEATGGESTGVITYASNNQSVATVDNDGIVTIVGVGTAIITATKAESDNYLAITSEYTLIINKAEQADFAFTATVKIVAYDNNGTFTQTATGGSGSGFVNYASSNNSVAIVYYNGEVTIKGVGSTTITASKAESANYFAATAVYVLTIDKAEQANFAFAISDKEVDITDADFTQIVDGEEAGTTTYTSENANVAVVDEITGTVTIISEGSTKIIATNSGDANYLPATVFYTLTVIDSSKTEQANFAFTTTIKTAIYGDGTFTQTAIGGDGTGTIIYTSSADTVASVDDYGTVTIIGVGTTIITATKAGDDDYQIAIATYTLTIAKANQAEFSIGGNTTKTFSTQSFIQVATGIEGEGITTYQSSNPDVAVFNNDLVTLLSVGTTTITAINQGDDNYNSATATYLLTVIQAPIFISTDTFVISENTTFVADILLNESDATLAISGENEALFMLMGNTLSFKQAPDFETPQGGADNNSNTYTIIITAIDAQNPTLTTQQTITITLTNVNDAPIKVNAGTDQIVMKGDSVTLSGTALDVDFGDNLSYTWTQTDNSATFVILSSPNTFTTNFIAPMNLTGDDIILQFTLTVTDSANASATDTVTITVRSINATPTALNANAGNAAVSLSWNAVANVNDYSVYYAISSFVGVSDAETYAANNGGGKVDVSGISVIIDNLSIGKVYYFVVQTNNSNPLLNSLLSAEVSATPIKNEQADFAFTATVKISTYGSGTFTQTATGGDGSGTITYTSSTDTVATVDNNGVVTIIGIGSTTITATKAENDNYFPATATYTLTVNKAEQTGFAFADSTKTVNYGGNNFTETASGGAGDGTITYTSSAPSVATVDNNGTVTIIGIGSTTITATKAESANHLATTATYTLNITFATLDIDADGTISAATDGVLIIRYLLNPSAAILDISGIGMTSTVAFRTTSTEILDYLKANKTVLDIDGDGRYLASTDGILLLNHILNPTATTADTITASDAIGEDATKTPEKILEYLNSLNL